jgi:hypothetical protein
MSKKNRSRKGKGNSGSATTAARPPTWSELEQSFFAAAPPDVPAPVGELERFDDLDVGMPPRRERFPEVIRHLVDALSALRLDLRTVTVAIGAVMVLIGLSAVVFAGRGGGHPTTPAGSRPAAHSTH